MVAFTHLVLIGPQRRDSGDRSASLVYGYSVRNASSHTTVIGRAMKPTAIILGEIPFELDALSELVEIQRNAFSPGVCPDLFILVINVDVLNGVEICRGYSVGCPKSKLVIETDDYQATKYHNQLKRAGAHGFCLLSSGSQCLVDAVKTVFAGDMFLDPRIGQLLKQSPPNPVPELGLTDREIEVIKLLGFKNEVIAEKLDMKLRTVQKHIDCICAKLKVPTRTAAALKAVSLGYTVLPPSDQNNSES